MRLITSPIGPRAKQLHTTCCALCNSQEQVPHQQTSTRAHFRGVVQHVPDSYSLLHLWHTPRNLLKEVALIARAQN